MTSRSDAVTAAAPKDTGRKGLTLGAIVLFCALVQGLADWVLFIAGTIALRFVLGMAPDTAMFQVSAFPWMFEVLAVLGTPAAIYGAAIGWPEVFGRGASFLHALLCALVIGIASVLVLTALWPDRDPPEFPMRSIELVKVLSFVTTGLACWWVVRRGAFGLRQPAP